MLCLHWINLFASNKNIVSEFANNSIHYRARTHRRSIKFSVKINKNTSKYVRTVYYSQTSSLQ